MGKTLKVLADLVDARAHRTVLRAKEQIGPSLDRLVFGCEEFRTATTDPCDVTAIRIAPNDFRRYTPALLDREAAELTIIVQRHGGGPGEALIASWLPGDEVRLTRWASTRSFRWPAEPGPVALIGDGTVVSLALAMADRAAAQKRPLRTLLEVAEGDVPAVRGLLPAADVVASGPEPGAALDAWLTQHRDDLVAGDEPVYYLAGHGQSIQRQRTFLRREAGVDRRRIKTQPYWATGKVGL